MSLESSKKFDHKAGCNCSRLALALEVVNRETKWRNDMLEKINDGVLHAHRTARNLLVTERKLLATERKTNAELRLRLALQAVIIKEYKDHREKFAPSYQTIENLYKYISLLEDFIQTNTAPFHVDMERLTKKRKLD